MERSFIPFQCDPALQTVDRMVSLPGTGILLALLDRSLAVRCHSLSWRFGTLSGKRGASGT